MPNQLLRPDVAPYATPDNALAPQPTWADAAQWHAQNLADTYAAMQNPQTWTDAAYQYGNALLMGSIAPYERVAGPRILDAVHVNPSWMQLSRLMTKHDPTGGLRLLPLGDDYAVADAYSVTHDDMISTLERAAHPSVKNASDLPGTGSWSVDRSSGVPTVYGPDGTVIPASLWPQALQRALGRTE